MLRFTKIRFRNFLSVGDAWLEYALDTGVPTLIIGTNGVGKTSLLDALCFGLFGRPYRNVKKPALINTINNKGMEVEVSFEVGGHRYVVTRGVKPTLFTVMKDGVLKEDLASGPEMQEWLERYVLKCTHKAFIQIVIMGPASYVPFMRLTPAARREIIEDILDVEVFSTMHSLLKARLVEIKSQVATAGQTLQQAQREQKIQQDWTGKWEQQRAEQDAVLRQKYDTTATQLRDLQAALAKLPEVEDHLDRTDVWRKRERRVTTLQAGLEQEQKSLKKSIDFYENHASCPTCEQKIEGIFKVERMTSYADRLMHLYTKILQARRLTSVVQERLSTEKTAAAARRELTMVRRDHQTKIEMLVQKLSQLKAEYKTFKEMVAPEPPKAEGIDADVAKKNYDTYVSHQWIIDQTMPLLKDTGIRATVVSHFLPAINARINHYLDVFSFPIEFTLDDQFVETIKSRYRDIFTYESFSEGEKRRIDLALILTWRDIASMKNCLNTNLVLFDEIFDSSLDVAGVDDLLILLKGIVEGTSVFVISHKEGMVDKFSQVITLKKERDFTVMVSEDVVE